MTGRTLSRWLTAVALRLEDMVEALIAALARLRGRRHPVIIPFIGHGTPSRARIGARIVLGEEAAAPPALTPGALRSDEEPSDDAPEVPSSPRRRRAVLRASLARFLTVEVQRAPVTIQVPGGEVAVTTNRDGYVDHDVYLPEVTPGWLRVELAGPDGSSAVARVLIVDPAADIGLVSDVDDTILDTGLTRGLEFLRATLLTDVHERTPLPGAAALYRAFVNSNPGPRRPVFYVSTSPWNLHEMLLQFVSMRGFPLGPLLLTDWGPSHAGLFRIGAQAHKVGLVRRLLAEHPKLKLVLIGDSGQEDPEIYATIARESPDRIAAIYIRHTTGVDLGRNAQVDRLAAEITAFGVPMLAADDSAQIAAHAAGLGLLDQAGVAAVRAELA
ncbi:MAG TPA: phosphatase domain-containing protein [Pseudonocardia sp.]|nr:phosphatase domain-containing protein [Pseudonocardia sp.]